MKNVTPRFILSLLVVVLLSMALVACGGGGDEAPPTEEAVVEEAPAEPTDAPEPTTEPEPTDEPTPEPAFDLSNELESTEVGYAVMYPTDWVSADLFGFGIVASSEELLDTPEPGADGAISLFIGGPKDEFGTEDDPVVLLEDAAAEAFGADDVEVTDGPTAVTINGNDGAILTYATTSDAGDPIVGYFLLVIGDEHAVVMISSTPEDEAETNLPIFEAIAQTLTLMPPVPAEASSETNGISANLPESSGFILYGDEIAGAITAEESVAWDFLGLAGETVNITVAPGEGLDVIVDVVDETGASILEEGEVDDSFEVEELTGIKIPASGTYYIVLRGFADTAGDFMMTVVESGTASSSADGGVTFGDTVSGVIDESGAPMAWNFAAVDGDVVGIVLTPYDEFDAVIDVLDASGNSILAQPRDASFGTENLLLAVPGDGIYTIQVSGFADGEGGFSTGDFDMELSQPLTNHLFASDTLEEDDLDEGHSFPVTVFEAGEMVGIIVEPEDDLDVTIQVYKDDVLVDIPGFIAEDGFDAAVGTENFVFIVPEDGTYWFRIKNSDDDYVGNLGDYEVQLVASSDAVIELATGDGVAAKTNSDGFVEYSLNVNAGSTITFEAEPYTDDADIVIEIEDLDGNALTEAMDNALSGETETLTHTFTEDGLVLIRISEFYGNANIVFVLSVTLE